MNSQIQSDLTKRFYLVILKKESKSLHFHWSDFDATLEPSQKGNYNIDCLIIKYILKQTRPGR